VFMRLQQNFWI